MGEGMAGNLTAPEAGEGGRPEIDNTACNPELLPTLADFYSGIDLRTGIVVFSFGLLAGIIIFTLYFRTVYHILKHNFSSIKARTIFILTIYPVVAVASLCVLLVPRSQLISEAVIQVMFMACLFELFCLLVTYCSGESGVIDKVPPKALNLRVVPCCCWPCCFFLPDVTLTKERLSYLRILVLQLPVVQTVCYFAQVLMFIEDQVIYQKYYIYIQPVIVASILIGVWGMVMTVRMLAPILKNYSVFAKYFILQLVLILTKFQAIFSKIPIWTSVFECKYPMTPALYSNMIYNSVLLWEMAFLAFLAQYFYKKPIPETYSTSIKVSNLPQKIPSLSEKIAKSEMFKENNNKCV